MKTWEKRLKHEQERCTRFPIRPTEDPTIWHSTLPGPVGSLYEGTEFVVEFRIPSTYPFKAPIAQFQTPIYHVNIHESGTPYCSLYDIWNPSMTLQTVMEYFENILKTPEPGFSYNYEASLLLQKDWTAYEAAVRDSLSKMRPSEANTVHGTSSTD
jgi:ubiquitin-protein ligase